MLRKTWVVGTVLLGISTSALCSGFYVGAGFGPSFADFEKSAHVVHTGYSDMNVFDKSHLASMGMFGTVFGGYGYVHKHFYLGEEINVSIDSVDSEASNNDSAHLTFSTTNYMMNRSCGVSVLPGLLVTDKTLLYARLGYANGNLKITTGDTSLANVDKNLNGFRFGAGIKQSLSQKVSVRMEYSQVNYGKTTTLVPVDSITKDTTITPSLAQVEFGLVYDFA